VKKHLDTKKIEAKQDIFSYFVNANIELGEIFTLKIEKNTTKHLFFTKKIASTKKPVQKHRFYKI
jgi:hypothetical protein